MIPATPPSDTEEAAVVASPEPAPVEYVSRARKKRPFVPKPKRQTQPKPPTTERALELYWRRKFNRFRYCPLQFVYQEPDRYGRPLAPPSVSALSITRRLVNPIVLEYLEYRYRVSVGLPADIEPADSFQQPSRTRSKLIYRRNYILPERDPDEYPRPRPVPYPYRRAKYYPRRSKSEDESSDAE